MRLPRGSHSPFRAFLFALFLIVSLLTGLPTTWAQSSAQSSSPSTAQLPPAWNDAVARLASRIASLAGSQKTISITVKNISSLTEAETAGIRQAIEAELTRRRFHLKPASSVEMQVEVTLSEGVSGYVWVAQVRGSDTEQLAIVTLTGTREGTSGPLPVIARNIVGQQRRPFLDFFWKQFLAGRIVRFWALDANGIADQSAEGADAIRDPAKVEKRFASRDPRGQILDATYGQTRAMISGALCVGDSSSGWFCGDPQGGLWPFANGIGSHYVFARNYFTGLSFGPETPELKQPAFYSIAFRQLDHGEWWITTELDGKARLYQDDPPTVFSGWGDEIATIETGCDREWQVLVTGAGDWTRPDHIQIYEIRERQAVAVGQPLEFPGPILALWPSTDMRSARVVSRNLQTGMYEASIVSVTCSE